MKGCRGLTEEEINKLIAYFEQRIKKEDRLSYRDYYLIFLSIYTGLRISEMLSLVVGDIYKYGLVENSIYLQRKNTKKKYSGRIAFLNDEAKDMTEKYLEKAGLKSRPKSFLFPSQKDTKMAIDRIQAWRIFKKAFHDCQFLGKLGTHTGRKTLAKMTYEKSDKDMLVTQKALGHARLENTVSYLQLDEQKLKDTMNLIKFR